VKKKVDIVIFGDLSNIICRILVWQLVKISKKNNIKIDKFFNTEKNKESLIINSIKFFLVKLFNPFNNSFFFNNTGIFLKLFSGLKIQNVEDINDNKFRKILNSKKYDYAFSLCCNQIFKKKTIKCFKKVINYHSSTIPLYRGLNSTLWSIFFNEKYTGYTYHYVNSKIDSGKIIFQDKFKINYKESYKKTEIIKTLKAKISLEKVIKLILNNFKGISLKKKGSYYGRKEIKKILTYKKINNINLIKKVISIWGGIVLIKDNKKFFITKISDSGNILRISHYPVIVYKMLKFIKN
tara:strand:- start:5538 stop:6422 length:885 start_codon:yes stop_codon:yes gene_type:complete